MKILNPFYKKEKPRYKITEKYLTFKFVGGLATGFGTVVGATILVAFLLFLLGQLKVIPVIGDIAAEIVQIVKNKTD